MAHDQTPTKEDIKTQRDKMMQSLESNLKNSFFLKVLAVNELTAQHTKYGTDAEKIAESQYDKVFGSEDANKIRQDIYNQENSLRKKMGIADRPDYASNYQVTKYAIGLVEEAVAALPVSKLEEIIGGIDKRAKTVVPDQIKQYEAMISHAIDAGLEEGKDINEIELPIDKENEEYIQAYREKARIMVRFAAAIKRRDAHTYDEINSNFDRIAKKYREVKGIPEPEAEKAKEKK